MPTYPTKFGCLLQCRDLFVKTYSRMKLCLHTLGYLSPLLSSYHHIHLRDGYVCTNFLKNLVKVAIAHLESLKEDCTLVTQMNGI